MQNRTDIVGVSLWDRIRQTLRSHREVGGFAGSALAGYILAGSTIFGTVSPFGAAFCAAVAPLYSITSAAGAVLGYTFSSASPQDMKYIVAVLMVTVARWLFEPKTPGRYRVPVASIISVLSLLVANGAVMVLGEPTLYDFIMAVAELFMACGATFFFARAFQIAGEGLAGANRSDLSCIAIALAVVIMGLSNLSISGVSLGKILAVLGILLCARYAREPGGAIGGITMGLALGLSGGDYAYLLISCGFGGLVSGIFGGMGRVATAASYIFVNTVAALFTLDYLEVYYSVIEVFLASVIFVAIPQSVTGRLLTLRSAAPTDADTRTALCERLEDISGALREICTTTRQVSHKLGEMEQSNYTAIYTRTAEQVCARCGMKTSCWQFRYQDTTAAMEQCISHLKREGTITKSQMPKRFVDSCCKAEEFAAALDSRFHDFVAKEGVQRKVSRVRSVVTDQFEGVALMLDEICGDLGSMKLLESVRIKKVRDYFEKEGLSTRHVLCYTDSYDHITVEIQIPNYQVAKLQKERSTLDLCALLEADFEPPQVTSREKYASVVYSEKATYTIETGAYQIAAGNGKLCGDAWDVVRNRDGRAHLVLSDGMGSGGSAAVDSAMASGLITRLISVGIGHEAALKMVNSALLIKSGEESLATIDICTLDLYTGRAEFYKAGAAPTYVIKGGRAGYVESTSLPAGILQGVDFEKSSLTLHEGDLILMVSDGVIATGTDWLRAELDRAGPGDMQQLCERVADTAKLRRSDGREDDITVVAALVQKGV